MNTTDKLRNLLRAVKERTKAGQLQWEETPIPDAFKVLFASGTFIVSREKLYGAEADAFMIRVELLTLGGRTAYQFGAASTAPKADGFDELFDLWQLARTNARKGDQLLDELLREVG